mgnify:CR=1 FL=1
MSPEAGEAEIAALKQIYALYEAYTQTLSLACRKYCAHCCTCNVTMTRLEAAYIYRELSAERQAALRRALAPQLEKKRYQPAITLNRMAELCMTGADLPEEEIDPAWGPCPLLTDKACPIYEVRPFGCRCLLSTRNCGETGAAEIDDYTITVNYVFLQFIEHIDQEGFSGNFADVLTAMQTDAAEPSLIANRPIPALLIPPAHQTRIKPLVDQLHTIITSA